MNDDYAKWMQEQRDKWIATLGIPEAMFASDDTNYASAKLDDEHWRGMLWPEPPKEQT